MENETPEVEGHSDNSLVNASDADLDAIINGQPLHETDEESESEPETDDDQPNEGEALEEEDATEEEPSKFATREELQKLQAVLEGQGKQLDGQELLLQRRASEINTLKQELKKFIKEADDVDEDSLSPRQAAKLEAQVEKAKGDLEAAEAEEQYIGRVVTSQEAVKKFVKPQEWDTDAMLTALERDAAAAGTKLSPAFKESFKQNPYPHGTADGLVHLAKRTFAEKIALQAIMAVKAMKAELDKVKKSTKPESVINGVSRALRKSPPLNGSTGGTTKSLKKPSIQAGDIPNLGDEDLEKFLSETR